MTYQIGMERFSERRAQAYQSFAEAVRDVLECDDDAVAKLWRRLEVKSLRVHHKRQQHIPRAPIKVRMTEELAEAARQMRADDPSLSLQEIANALGITVGRVSESLAGLA